MLRRYGTSLRLFLIFADVLLTVAMILVLSSLMARVYGPDFWSTSLPSPQLGLLLYVSAWITTLWLNGAYRLRPRLTLSADAGVVIRSALLVALGTFAFLYLAKLPEVSRAFLIALFAVQVTMTLIMRALLRRAFETARRHGRNTRWVVVLGTGGKAREFADKLHDHPELGLRVIGFMGPEEGAIVWPIIGSMADLPEVIHDRVVDEVAICLPESEWIHTEALVRLCEQEGKIVRIPVPMPRLALATSHVDDLGGMPILSMVMTPGTALSLAAKRLIDVAGALAAMVALSPLFLLVSLAIVISDGRPILYRQTRVGLHGRRFEVVKFRTMVRDADRLLEDLRHQNELTGHAFKITDDPRITRVGRFLRRSSLDELPQIWNVLRGEMSLVGPRPPLPHEVAAYDPWHRRRLSMPPGITGLWQISGRREIDFDRWVQLDLEYIDHWTPWLDILIMLRTIPAVLRAEGR